jgi:acyl-coenzyme A synthetase/AMP-(fatty) acid ligase
MLLMSSTYEAYDLSSLQVITYGTEPMPESTLRGINSLLPAVKLKQTYGLTEVGIFSTQSQDSHSNWMKIGGRGAEVKVVNGTLWVRTETAMLGYLNAPSPFDAEGWYNTGDQVEVHGEYMKILGRKEDVINVGGEKVFPAEVESILLKMPNIKEVVVAKKKNPVTGQIVTAVVNTEKPEIASELKMRMIDFCKGQLERYKIPALITITPESLVGSRFKKMRSFALSEVTK